MRVPFDTQRALTVYSTALASLMRRLGLEETVIEADEMQPIEWLEITGIERNEQGDLVRMRVRRKPTHEGEIVVRGQLRRKEEPG